ncbi:MAG: hypothetical protein R2844_07145 [Caldilineales bacterium]
MENQMDQIATPVERMIEQFSVSRSFGEVIREGDTAVVPVAEVNGFFGYGYGSGEGPVTGEEDDVEARMASGGGGGGGGRGSSKPRGYITISPDGVHYEPLMDPLKVSLAGIAMGAWVIFWVAMVVRSFMKD